MKTFAALLVVMAAVVALSGCGVVAAGPVIAPLAVDLKGPVTGFDNAVKADKTGTAVAEGVILFAWGDASIDAAVKNGRLTKVHHVDSKVTNILGVYAKYETIAYGE
jgi:hypothetical protein